MQPYRSETRRKHQLSAWLHVLIPKRFGFIIKNGIQLLYNIKLTKLKVIVKSSVGYAA